MDTNMEDVGRAPAEASPVLNFEPTTIPTLDGWIESLMSCKQLAEADVQRLCDKPVVTTLTEATTLLRLSPFLSPSRSDTLNESQSSEETTSPVRSLRSTASTTNASVNMETLMSGSILPTSLTTSPSLP
ncbi:hypothetical protein LB505_003225 [Fusarium chuoi]|nr:hypothetical protein LB505_003225 [Fusarium chuoi]